MEPYQILSHIILTPRPVLVQAAPALCTLYVKDISRNIATTVAWRRIPSYWKMEYISIAGEF